jgi:hypothetical protein
MVACGRWDGRRPAFGNVRLMEGGCLRWGLGLMMARGGIMPAFLEGLLCLGGKEEYSFF